MRELCLTELIRENMNIQIVKRNAAFTARARNWLATLLLVLLPLQAVAEYQRLEAIVAVDDDVVLASELMTRWKPCVGRLPRTTCSRRPAMF